MATKHIISPGIGFTPGGVKYIVTRGLIAAPAVVAPTLVTPDGRIYEVESGDRVYEVESGDRVYEPRAEANPQRYS